MGVRTHTQCTHARTHAHAHARNTHTHTHVPHAQDLVDQHLRAQRLPPIMQAVMGGVCVQQIICRGVPYRSEREEEFFQARVCCCVCVCCAHSQVPHAAPC